MIMDNLNKTTQKVVSGKAFNEIVDICLVLAQEYSCVMGKHIKALERNNKREDLLRETREQYTDLANKYQKLSEELKEYKNLTGISATTVPPISIETKLDRDTLIRLERYEEVAELDRRRGLLI